VVVVNFVVDYIVFLLDILILFCEDCPFKNINFSVNCLCVSNSFLHSGYFYHPFGFVWLEYCFRDGMARFIFSLSIVGIFVTVPLQCSLRSPDWNLNSINCPRFGLRGRPGGGARGTDNRPRSWLSVLSDYGGWKAAPQCLTQDWVECESLNCQVVRLFSHILFLMIDFFCLGDAVVNSPRIFYRDLGCGEIQRRPRGAFIPWIFLVCQGGPLMRAHSRCFEDKAFCCCCWFRFVMCVEA